jgi:hypothetical protein
MTVIINKNPYYLNLCSHKTITTTAKNQIYALKFSYREKKCAKKENLYKAILLRNVALHDAH